ncbi:hydantoinase/carbamoylase family amidase, partial [Streptomyces sp. NPDC057052]|uniref:hydantoinase/carbamoylase family amidase n=1 Tax=Streptomyces sp. NPDC057052 TaxID=3346010 RepID=UPI0036394C78
HLDTVPCGGKFDGVAGIMAALEVLTTLSENGFRPRRPIEMVAFINEEAIHYKPGHFGSMAICGMLPDDFANTCTNQETGITLRQAMLDFDMGLDPDNFTDCYIHKGDYYAFIELHVEQGAYLLKEDLPMAVVTAIAGIKHFYITLNGVAAHAGGMAMEDRHDAASVAAAIACEVERLAKTSSSATRGTVGSIQTYPGQVNIIAGKAVVSVDFREADEEIFEKLYTDLLEYVENLCNIRGLTYSVRVDFNTPPAVCHSNLVALIDSNATALNIPHKKMVSYPAHDAMQMARLFPMGMIFLRSSNDGVAHCPEEYTTVEDMAAGTTVLLQTLKDLSEKDFL